MRACVRTFGRACGRQPRIDAWVHARVHAGVVVRVQVALAVQAGVLVGRDLLLVLMSMCSQLSPHLLYSALLYCKVCAFRCIVRLHGLADSI